MPTYYDDVGDGWALVPGFEDRGRWSELAPNAWTLILGRRDVIPRGKPSFAGSRIAFAMVQVEMISSRLPGRWKEADNHATLSPAFCARWRSGYEGIGGHVYRNNAVPFQVELQTSLKVFVHIDLVVSMSSIL